MNDLIFYVNGAFVPADEAVLPVNDLGLVRGYGVFDVLRTYDRIPFHLHDHLNRLHSSAQQIGLDLPWSVDELAHLVDETHECNEIDNALIRIVATGGPSHDFGTPQGNPSLAIMVTPLLPPSSDQYAEGRKAITVEMVRERPTAKSLNYIGAIMAVQEAKESGAVEALYRTPQCEITEGTRSNFFVLRGDQLITPMDEVLPGITRKVVLHLAHADFDVVERPIRYGELATIDEAFITSSTKELLPIVQIDDQVIGDGVPGRHTRALLARFRQYAGSVA